MAVRILLEDGGTLTSRDQRDLMDRAGMIVNVFSPRDEHFDARELKDYEIVILDPKPIGVTVFDTLSLLRTISANVPILVLSKSEQHDRELARLNFSADNILAKPFDLNRLIPHIRKMVRLSRGHVGTTIITGRISHDFDRGVVTVNDLPVRLTLREYCVLELLSLRKGTTLTKEMFLDHLYGGLDEPELKIIEVFICKLRKKLKEATDGEHYIETVWGRGYVLRDPA